jgi:regulator of RNase E activity RraA
VAVVQDIDRTPGLGAFAGEVHCSILQALVCAGYVTNGTVRYLHALEATGFQLFAAGPAVSHAYAHLIDFGGIVEVGGLSVSTGDLLHGDQHGVLNVPLQIAGEIPRVVEEIAGQRCEVIEFCKSPKFSVKELEGLIKQQP